MSLWLLVLVAFEALSLHLPVCLEVRSKRGSVSVWLFVQGIDNALGGHDTNHFLLHLVICFDHCIFEDLLSDALGKTLKELLHCVVIHWVVANFMSNAFKFRDILIYLWPGHFQRFKLYSGSLSFLGVHEAVAKISDELLVGGVIIICGLQSHQPLQLLLGPSVDFGSFDTGEGNSNPFDEGGEGWDVIVNEEVGGKFSEKALSF